MFYCIVVTVQFFLVTTVCELFCMLLYVVPPVAGSWLLLHCDIDDQARFRTERISPKKTSGGREGGRAGGREDGGNKDTRGRAEREIPRVGTLCVLSNCVFLSFTVCFCMLQRFLSETAFPPTLTGWIRKNVFMVFCCVLFFFFRFFSSLFCH